MITPFGELPNRLAKDMSMAEQHEWLARRVSRRSILVGGTAGIFAATLPAWFDASSAFAASRGTVFGRQLAYGPDPRTSMYVSFASANPVSRGVVRAHPVGGSTIEAPAQISGVPGTATRYGRALLTGLRPGTTYHYTINVDRVDVSYASLRTAGDEAADFRFTAFGDQDVRVQSFTLLRRVALLSPSLHLVAGDLCYADSSGRGGPGDVFNPRKWDTWLAQNDPVASRVPWMCAVGNHDMEPGFGEHGYAGLLTRLAIGGQSPVAVPVASSFVIGNVGFIGLDSNDVSFEIGANRGWTNHAQTSWLRGMLATLRARSSKVDFIVAFLHSGPYGTSRAHPAEGGVRQEWVPLFDEYGVDLVISGHSHAYERTQPLRAGLSTASGAGTLDSRAGTTYVTAGGGGAFSAPGFHPECLVATARGIRSETAPWALPATRTTEHVVLCADVSVSAATGTTAMLLRAIDAQGLVRDEVRLQRPHKVASHGGDVPYGYVGAATGVLFRARRTPHHPAHRTEAGPGPGPAPSVNRLGSGPADPRPAGAPRQRAGSEAETGEP